MYREKKDRQLEFRYQTLKVGPAVNPELMNWQNIGLPKYWKYIRYSFFVCCILAGGYGYIRLLLNLQTYKLEA